MKQASLVTKRASMYYGTDHRKINSESKKPFSFLFLPPSLITLKLHILVKFAKPSTNL